MTTFKYRSKGSADDWTEESVEAKDAEDALKRLDAIYGVVRDDDGNQTNANVVEVELL